MRRLSPGLAAAALLPLCLSCAPPQEASQRAIEQARAALVRGEPARAADVLRARLRYAPRDGAAATELARFHLRHGDPGAALRVLEALPDDARADLAGQQVRARTLVALGRLWQASPLLVSLEERGGVEPDVVAAFLDGLAGREDAAKLGPQLPPPWRRELVRRLLSRREPEGALRMLDSLPAQDPHREALTDLVLRALVQQGAAEALRGYSQLLAGPDTPGKLLARHRLLLADHRAGEAAALEDRFLDLYPEDPDRYPMVLAGARRLTASGRPLEGLALATEAARLDPGRSEPQVLRALALDALGRREAARRALELAFAADPDDRAARELLARMRSGAGGPRTVRISLEPEP